MSKISSVFSSLVGRLNSAFSKKSEGPLPWPEHAKRVKVSWEKPIVLREVVVSGLVEVLPGEYTLDRSEEGTYEMTVTESQVSNPDFHAQPNGILVDAKEIFWMNRVADGSVKVLG